MRTRSTLLIALAALLSPILALGHENALPQSCMASNARVATTIYFRLTEQQLRDYVKAHKTPASDGTRTCDKEKDCGIIDEWYWANEAAKSTCAGGLSRGIQSVQSTPYITSPSSFNLDTDANNNGKKDHHELYGFEQGLTGMCVACP